MVKLGRVYRGMMVDMRARNAKLRRRAEAMVSKIVQCTEREAAGHLENAEGDVKIAVLIGLGLDRNEATQLLKRHGGNLRSAIKETTGADWPKAIPACNGNDEIADLLAERRPGCLRQR